MGPAAWLARQAQREAPDLTPRGLMLPTHPKPAQMGRKTWDRSQLVVPLTLGEPRDLAACPAWVEQLPTAAAGERVVQATTRPAMFQSRQSTTRPWIHLLIATWQTRRPGQTQTRLCAPLPMAQARDAPARCKARVTTPRGGAVVCPARPTEDSRDKAAAIGTAVSGLTFLRVVRSGRLCSTPRAVSMGSSVTTANAVVDPPSDRDCNARVGAGNWIRC